VVERECISVHPESSPASAWTGTHFMLKLAARTGSSGEEHDRAGTTTVVFHRVGYDDRSDNFESNEAARGKCYRI
jgi:hypothetical protein